MGQEETIPLDQKSRGENTDEDVNLLEEVADSYFIQKEEEGTKGPEISCLMILRCFQN